jgi:hypothetical protein
VPGPGFSGVGRPAHGLSSRRRVGWRGWHPADSPRRPFLFINPRSGGGRAKRIALAERARERGIEPVVVGSEDDLAALVRRAAADGADALGMAGSAFGLDG